MPRNKTPLENLIDDIYDPDDADPSALEAELRADGVDVDEERLRYEATVTAAVNLLRRQRLNQARSTRLSETGRRAQALGRVRGRNLAADDLIRRIKRAPDHHIAHREFESATQEDLESLLADLLLLMGNESLLDDL